MNIPTAQDWDAVEELVELAVSEMQKFQTDKGRKVGPYSPVGQATWRLNNALSHFQKEVPRPKGDHLPPRYGLRG